MYFTSHFLTGYCGTECGTCGWGRTSAVLAVDILVPSTSDIFVLSSKYVAVPSAAPADGAAAHQCGTGGWGRTTSWTLPSPCTTTFLSPPPPRCATDPRS
eukprot:3612418-Rhodomonas_salina.1